MIENLNEFKKDVERASELGKDITRKINLKNYNKIVFCGIGGSAVAGEVVRSLDLKIPVFIIREELPKFVDKKTLCFIISYSGNTAETIGLYKSAKKKGCGIIIVCSGGKLGKVNDDKVIVPCGYVPREAFVYLLFPVLNILKIKYRVNNIIKNINEKEMSRSKKLAKELKGKIPIVYVDSEKLGFLGYRFQTFFNENCKILSHSNYFPELAHNEIEAETGKDFKFILLVDKKTRVVKKANRFLKFFEIRIKGKSLIEKVVYALYFEYMTSYYLSKVLKVDYRVIKKIEGLKR